MSFSTKLAKLVADQLARFVTLNRHQLAGQVANLDFWLDQVRHGLAVVDGYGRRFQRLKAADLPATVTLSDGMGMLPTLKLSQFPQVIVGARVSKSGNAIAQSGDLQTLSPPIDVATTVPIKLVIDQVVP